MYNNHFDLHINLIKINPKLPVKERKARKVIDEYYVYILHMILHMSV